MTCISPWGLVLIGLNIRLDNELWSTSRKFSNFREVFLEVFNKGLFWKRNCAGASTVDSRSSHKCHLSHLQTRQMFSNSHWDNGNRHLYSGYRPSLRRQERCIGFYSELEKLRVDAPKALQDPMIIGTVVGQPVQTMESHELRELFFHLPYERYL